MPAPPLSTGAQVHTDMQIQAILEVRTVRQYLVKWTNQTESWVLADDVQLQTSRITNANISVPQESQEYCVDVESGITSTSMLLLCQLQGIVRGSTTHHLPLEVVSCDEAFNWSCAFVQ